MALNWALASVVGGMPTERMEARSRGSTQPAAILTISALRRLANCG